MNLPSHLTGQNAQHRMASQNQGMPMGMNSPDGEMPMEDEEKNPQILAHFSLEEIEDLAELGPIEVVPEEETGGVKIWDLSGLDPILKSPELAPILDELVARAKQEEQPQGFALGGMAEGDLGSFKEAGRGGDKELAIITKDMADIFDAWNDGETDINPVTGFPEYKGLGGLFKKILPIAGGIVGSIYGGPLGGALGAGLGSAVGGGKAKDVLTAGALGGLGGSMFGGMGSGASSVGMLGGLLGGGAKSPNPQLDASINKSIYSRPDIFAANAQSPNKGGLFGGNGSGLLSGMGMPLAIAGMGIMGHNQDQKKLSKFEKERKEESDKERERLGWDEPFDFNAPKVLAKGGEVCEKKGGLLKTMLPSLKDKMPSHKSGYNTKIFKPKTRAEGGAVIGQGKGQDDLIPRDLPNNSYIIDASTVSDLGDGSTHAGFRELDHYFGKGSPIKRAQGGKVKALLSDGEYEISPDHVSEIGHGSYENGAKDLDAFVKKIRAQKRTSGKKLPPKSKSVGGYLSKLSHA